LQYKEFRNVDVRGVQGSDETGDFQILISNISTADAYLMLNVL
jgi:hypothetical protein